MRPACHNNIVRKIVKGVDKMFKKFDTYTDRDFTAEERAHARKVCKNNPDVANVPTEVLMAALVVANDDMLCAWMCDATGFKKTCERIRAWYKPAADELARRMA